MSNEITWSAIKSDSERLVIIGEILAALADSFAIPNHPALMWGPDLQSAGSDTVYVDEDNLESGATLTSIAEGGTYANTALTTDRFSAAIGEYYTQWTASDLAVCVAPNGKLDPARFARSLVKRYGLTITNLLATNGATFAGNVKDAGSGDPTMEDLFDAIAVLENAYVDPSKPKMALVHPVVAQALRKDALFAQQMNVAMQLPEVQAMAAAYGGVYVGRFMNTDVFASFKVTTSGGKYQNAIFAHGAMLLAKATPKVVVANQYMLEMMLMEQQVSETKPETYIRGKAFLGADVAQDGAGVLWTTAA